ncbi:hypothetical protein [Terasakiella sp.]|uniref:hypothetical protein n=1 Tax=Terasakiella sp. TaxID=2034861 RepID=UPI003AA8DC0B
MAQKLEIPLAKPIKYPSGESDGAPVKTVNSLLMREATMSDLSHVVLGNAPISNYAEVVARCCQNVDAEFVRCGSGRNAGLFTNWVVGQFLSAEKGAKVQGMISDDEITLFAPAEVKKKSNGQTEQVKVAKLKMREPTIEEVGFIPSEVVTIGHYLELAANCVSGGVPENAVRNCSAENALPIIAWAANFIGAAPEIGAI